MSRNRHILWAKWRTTLQVWETSSAAYLSWEGKDDKVFLLTLYYVF